MTERRPNPAAVVAGATEKLRESDERIGDDTIRFVEALKLHGEWLTEPDTNAAATSNEVRKQAILTLRDAPLNLLMATAMLMTVTGSQADEDEFKAILAKGPAGPRDLFIKTLTRFIANHAGDMKRKKSRTPPIPAGRSVH